jgi:glycosyltransferase involved in cell wall biosynthesis
VRVLFIADLSATGFGSVTFGLGPELLKLGLDVRFVSQNDTGKDVSEPFRSRTVDIQSLVHTLDPLNGGINSNEPNRLLPSLFDGTVQANLLNGEPWGEWIPQAAILLGDVWATRMMVQRAKEQFAAIPSFNYTPIEGVDLSPRYRDDPWGSVIPVAMSNFGADELAKVMGTRPPMIYHGIDVEAFHPVGKAAKGSALGWPLVLQSDDLPDVTLQSRQDCQMMWSNYFAVPVPKTWMLRTDRHMPRKRYNAMLRAMVPVLYRHPDALLIIHCQQVDQGGNLLDSIAKLPGQRMLTPVSPDENAKPEAWSLFGRSYAQVVLTNAWGLSRDGLVSLYNAADLYLSTSAEGFGLTIAEAIACGVPAVGLDYSAVPEVIGPAGKLVPIGGLYDNEYDHFWAVPNEAAYTAAVDELLRRPTHRAKLGRKGPRHVAEHFRWDAAAADFAKLIETTVAERVAA